MKLRPYQQEAVEASINHMKSNLSSFVLDLATGAGKSLIVAEIAKFLQSQAAKKVLCLAPSKELVEQNRQKYLNLGLPASLWCASAGKKCLRHPVVFASPQSVIRSIEKFDPAKFVGVIIDEAHQTSNTILQIINHLKSGNPNLRICGLSATPYRMGTGYIYGIDIDGNTIPSDQTKNPSYDKLVYRITANQLIDMGFLTPPVADVEIKQTYDTSKLKKGSNGKFTQSSLDQCFVGHGRKTADIVADVVAASHDRLGVMFFGATIEHAQEIMASLPPENSRMVTGKTPEKEREKIVDDFKDRKYKYLVNVAVLTTGFDAPHVDLVAILRATESASLLQQIIGRGLRLDENKDDCLVMDFAGNIERHGLENDWFTPKIKVAYEGGDAPPIKIKCPLCLSEHEVSMRENPDEYEYDEFGYFVDLKGNRIEVEGKEMPAHYVRQCPSNHINKDYQFERCKYKWAFRECFECGHENDITARRCKKCRAELIDPNDKLTHEFRKIKADPKVESIYTVKSWECSPHITNYNNEVLHVVYVTDYGRVDYYYKPNSMATAEQWIWNDFLEAVFGDGEKPSSISQFQEFMNNLRGRAPKTILAHRPRGKYYKIRGHNTHEI